MNIDTIVKIICWLLLIAHLFTAVFAVKFPVHIRLVPVLNMLVSIGVLVYWLDDWLAWFTRGVRLYATDQLIPLFSTVVLAVSILYLFGKNIGTPVHWGIFIVHFIIIIIATLFMMFFKMDRLF